MFVAATQAAEDTEGAMCMMSTSAREASDASFGGPAEAWREGGPGQIAIPKSTSADGGDLAAGADVVDPYPSFNGVVVDSANDLVMMSDTNRKSLLVYGPDGRQPHVEGGGLAEADGSWGPTPASASPPASPWDPGHRELFTVNNDVEDRLVVFDYDARGNVTPKRCSTCPTSRGGIAFAPKRGRDALSVQTPNMFVVFKREAKKFDAPVRSVRGPKTQMADPHGIYFDETHNEVTVANHGNFRPGELIHRVHRVRRAGVAPGANRRQARRERARPVPALVGHRLRRATPTATSRRCASFRGRSARSTGRWASRSMK